MLLIRTELRDAALVALLAEAGSRGMTASLAAVPGSRAELCARDVTAGLAISNGAVPGDGPSVIGFPLDDKGILALTSVLGASLFADAGRGGEESLQVTGRHGDWVTCVFADRQAVVDETPVSWRDITLRRPELGAIVVGPLGADLMAEEAVEALVDGMPDLTDPAVVSMLRRTMAAKASDYEAEAVALGAAILAIEGAFPNSAGSLAWLPIGSPPEAIGTLAGQAVAVLRKISRSRRWQSKWRDVGLLEDALAEVSWYLGAVERRET